jgi:hypothetical protein
MKVSLGEKGHHQENRTNMLHNIDITTKTGVGMVEPILQTTTLQVQT